MVAEGYYGNVTPFDLTSRQMILRHLDMKIQKLRCNLHLLGMALVGLIEAKHVHGIDTGDNIANVQDVASLSAYLNHTNAPITEYNFNDYLRKKCKK